jgi:hypothetical protein
MNDSINNNNIKRSQSKKRSKSYRESKNSMSSYEKESIDAKDISLEVKSMKSTASTKKKHHHHHHHHSISRKKTNKSEFSRSKQKKVSFKQNLAEVVHIENWKIYNTDTSEDQINNISNSGKDKTKCACVLC